LRLTLLRRAGLALAIAALAALALASPAAAEMTVTAQQRCEGSLPIVTLTATEAPEFVDPVDFHWFIFNGFGERVEDFHTNIPQIEIEIDFESHGGLNIVLEVSDSVGTVASAKPFVTVGTCVTATTVSESVKALKLDSGTANSL